MGFVKINKNKSRRGRHAQQPALTISKAHAISLSTEAWELIGAPAHVYVEWDSAACMIRLVGTSSDDPDSFPLGNKVGPRFGARQLLRDLGLDPRGETRSFPVRRDSRFSLVADLSTMPASGKVTPIRRTA